MSFEHSACISNYSFEPHTIHLNVHNLYYFMFTTCIPVGLLDLTYSSEPVIKCEQQLWIITKLQIPLAQWTYMNFITLQIIGRVFSDNFQFQYTATEWFTVSWSCT